jgi:small nuclear ribonucleoprotein E
MQRKKIQKDRVKPISLLYEFYKSTSPIEIWLYENTKMRIQGHLSGFDEYMNLVLDNACEV